MTLNVNEALLTEVQHAHPGVTKTALVEEGLRASGVGWADTQVIVAAAKAGARLHTSDRYVRRVCKAIGVPLA